MHQLHKAVFTSLPLTMTPPTNTWPSRSLPRKPAHPPVVPDCLVARHRLPRQQQVVPLVQPQSPQESVQPRLAGAVTSRGGLQQQHLRRSTAQRSTSTAGPNSHPGTTFVQPPRLSIMQRAWLLTAYMYQAFAQWSWQARAATEQQGITGSIVVHSAGRHRRQPSQAMQGRPHSHA